MPIDDAIPAQMRTTLLRLPNTLRTWRCGCARRRWGRSLALPEHAAKTAESCAKCARYHRSCIEQRLRRIRRPAPSCGFLDLEAE